MGWVHYIGRAPSRARLIAGDPPAWVTNSRRASYIRAVILSAPPWVDRAALMRLHAQAAQLTKDTGALHVLDHDVPLQHPAVCGLSVPWNVRVVPWRVNASKGNRWHPEQLPLF